MRFNYLKFILIAVVLSIVIITVPQFASRVYAGATTGAADQTAYAVFQNNGGSVGTQIGLDSSPVNVEPGQYVFVCLQLNWTTVMKQRDMKGQWRTWGGTWQDMAAIGAGSSTAWEYWNSNYADHTVDAITAHFGDTNQKTYTFESDYPGYGGSYPTTNAVGKNESWFIIQAPENVGRYEIRWYDSESPMAPTATVQIDITVGTPPSVSTQAASSIGDNGATLNGNITDIGSDSVIERGFEWGYTTSYGSSWTEEGTFGTGTFNHAISGLDSGTTYHFRAKARNSVGWAYGADIEFTTTGLPTKPYLRVVQGNPRKGSATWWEWIVVNPTGSTITVTEVRVVDDTGTDWGWTADNTQGYPASGWTDGGTGGYYWSGSETVSAHSAKVFRSRPVQANISPSTSHTMTWSITVTGYSPAPQQTQVW